MRKTLELRPFRVLSGHSYGGLLVAHSFHTKPDLFQAHFAYSPSLFWDNSETVKKLIAFFENNPNHRNFLYMNMGNEGNPESESIEGKEMLKGVKKIEKELMLKNMPNMRYRFDYMNEEPHQNTPIYGAIGALRGLYPQWSIPYKTAIDGYDSVVAYFSELTAMYGYDIEPKECQMYDEGFAHLNLLDNPEEATKYFNYILGRNPSAYGARDGIVSAYLKLGKKSDALEHLNILLERDDLTEKERKELLNRSLN